MRKLLLILALALGAAAGFAQKTLSSDYIIAKDSVRINNRAFRQIVTVINSACTHSQAPTAKAVYDYLNANDDWGTQVVLTTDRFSGDGTDVAPLELARQGASTGEVLKWDGDAWTPAADNTGGGGGGSLENYESQSVTGSTITLSIAVPTSDFNQKIKIYRTGVKLKYTSDFTVSGSTITLVLPADGERFEIYTIN